MKKHLLYLCLAVFISASFLSYKNDSEAKPLVNKGVSTIACGDEKLETSDPKEITLDKGSEVKKAEAQSEYMSVAMPDWFKKLSDSEKRKYLADLERGNWVEVYRGSTLIWVDVDLIESQADGQLLYTRKKSVNLVTSPPLGNRPIEPERAIREGPYFQTVYYVDCKNKKRYSVPLMQRNCHRADDEECIRKKLEDVKNIPENAFLQKVEASKVIIPFQEDNSIFEYVCKRGLGPWK